ncbi:formate dehydrogenase subunit delta [Methylotenera versatilis]|uniref:formate dehydrogenase subunit delta n=1 Tax=Methylotenera versatilis TaxID=1055487 RepID=UPI000645D9E0|nr:formate dehydrogenase subunit delta [Methylotenera versatilis]
MQTEQLIKMANQVGDFFESYPDQVQAQQGIAEHLNRFWALAMRRQIAAHVKEANGVGLHAKVISAISSYLEVE